MNIDISQIDQTGFFGVNEANLRFIQALFPDVTVNVRGSVMKIEGSEADVQEFSSFFSRLRKKPLPLNEKTIMETFRSEGLADKDGQKVLIYGNNGQPIKARTPNQKKITEAIEKNDMLFALGPAGSGKTYTAVALAVKYLKEKRVKRIILTRPAVEAGENLGFLPGDLKEKLDPYLQPLYDALRDMLTQSRLDYYLENKIIEIAPLAFMRGRTLEQSFVILDEAQNATLSQIKMFLTRMGNCSKFIITGDPSQTDLPKGQPSGLRKARNILHGIKGIAMIELNDSDIVRNSLVTEIVRAFDRQEENKA